MLAVKLLTVFLLSAIFYQDVRARMVHGFLFPLTALFLGILHYFNVEKTGFYIGVAGNMIFISVLILFLFLYSKIKLKRSFLHESFGLGDMLFFYAVCFAFPNYTFAVLFVFSVLFSLFAHLALKKKMKDKTVPLAGYMSLFFAITFGISMLYKPFSLYLL
ncbi:MAG: hypothetical protein KDD04_04185, partial [Sinomicrobium sp.]|nr:hypothetical protein [Sinomicrobium sp.]